MKILLAIDSSPCSEMAVNELARRPWPEDSEVKIICVPSVSRRAFEKKACTG
jgi:hypothetical protein